HPLPNLFPQLKRSVAHYPNGRTSNESMRRASTLVWFLLMSGGLFAQEGAVADASRAADSPTATRASRATLRGVVAKDPGGEPVKKVLMELIAENQNEGGNYTAVTEADGSFRIEGILPGRYRLFAERTGYQGVDSRRRS